MPPNPRVTFLMICPVHTVKKDLNSISGDTVEWPI